MKIKSILFSCLLTVPFWGATAFASWSEPGVSFSTGFYYFDSVDIYGTDLKMSSNSSLNVKPEMKWYLNPQYDQFIAQLMVRQYDFILPTGVTAINNNPSIYFGGNIRYQKIWHMFNFSLGFDAQQHPIISAIDAYTLQMNKAMIYSFPAEISNKLIILEHQVFRVGVTGSVAIPTSDVGSAYRTGAFLRHELRHEVRVETTISYETQTVTSPAGIKQGEVEIAFNFKFSFPGRRGLTPEPYERD